MHTPLAFRRPWLAGAAFVVASLSTHAQTALGFAESLQRAEARSAALDAARHAAFAARESAVAAAQWPDPQLILALDNLPVSGADRFSTTQDFMTMRRVGVVQEVIPGDKREARRRVGERAAERGEADAAVERALVRKEAATAWLDARFAAQAVTLLEALQAEAQLQLRSFDSQVRAGKAAPAEQPLLQAMAVQLADRVLAAQSDGERSLLALSRWVGEPARVEPSTGPDIGRLPGSADIASTATPEQRAALQQQASAEAELALATLNKQPNWSWEASYAQRGPAYSNMVSLGVVIPLPLFPKDRQDRETSARQAQVAQAAARAEEVRRSQQLEVQRLLLQWRSLLDRHDRLTAQLLPLGRTRTAAALAAYRSGQGSLALVLAARQAEVETALQLLERQREAARLWAQLTYQYLDAGDMLAQGARP